MNPINFEPTKRFALVEEAIQEAVHQAKETGNTYNFNCNGLPMLITTNSNAEELLSRYWKYKHAEGVANGSIIEFDIPIS